MSSGDGITILDLSGGEEGGGLKALSEHKKKIATIAVAVVALAIAASSFFQVGADSVGVVLRFGEVHRTVEPGLHFKIPLGVEEPHIVPTRKQLKQEFGFRTIQADERTQYATEGYEDESLMLTGDLNVVDVQWTIQYRITDAEDYLFQVRNVDDTLRFVTQAVMREVVGDRTVNEVLTVGRADLAVEVNERLQQLADRYEMGISVSDIILQDITPPGPVRPSFDEVNQAQQDQQRLINEARRDYNAAVPRARGEAKQIVQRAEGYKIQRVNRAEGQVARFRNLYEEYVEAPEITRQRIYLETMGEALPQIDNLVIVDSSAENVIPLLPSGTGAGLGIGTQGLQGGQQ